jgi:hypothetical protein
VRLYRYISLSIRRSGVSGCAARRTAYARRMRAAMADREIAVIQ